MNSVKHHFIRNTPVLIFQTFPYIHLDLQTCVVRFRVPMLPGKRKTENGSEQFLQQSILREDCFSFFVGCIVHPKTLSAAFALALIFVVCSLCFVKSLSFGLHTKK